MRYEVNIKKFETNNFANLVAAMIVGGLFSYFDKSLNNNETALLTFALFVVCRVYDIEKHLKETTKPVSKCDDCDHYGE